MSEHRKLRFQWLNYYNERTLLTYIQVVITPRLFALNLLQNNGVGSSCKMLRDCFNGVNMRAWLFCLIGGILLTSEWKELRVDILKRVFPNEARGTL